jgi:hypothetical protein
MTDAFPQQALFQSKKSVYSTILPTPSGSDISVGIVLSTASGAARNRCGSGAGAIGKQKLF